MAMASEKLKARKEGSFRVQNCVQKVSRLAVHLHVHQYTQHSERRLRAQPRHYSIINYPGMLVLNNDVFL